MKIAHKALGFAVGVLLASSAMAQGFGRPGGDAVAPLASPAGESVFGALSDMDMPPIIPGVMGESRFKALKKLFESEDAEIQRGALCQFASEQQVRGDSHSLALIKTFVRLVEKHTPKDSIIKPETTYACALQALTATILTHGTFRESTQYKQVHFGDIGTPAYLREQLIPIYLPIIRDEKHPLHIKAYYAIMVMGEAVAEASVPVLVEQINAVDGYTYKNQEKVETLLRVLHVMGRASLPAVPKMLELLIKDSEVDYEGNYGYDGKRGLNAELSASLVEIAGYEKKYQRVLLKAINRAIEQDEIYWSDKLKPVVTPGTTDMTATMEQSRDKLLKIMGLEDVREMKDLF